MAKVLQHHRSNSTSEDDDAGMECPLSGPQALAACKEFASATSTDTGLAMMMLQQNGWDLQRAIDVYHNTTQEKTKSKTKKSASSNSKRMKAEEATTCASTG